MPEASPRCRLPACQFPAKQLKITRSRSIARGDVRSRGRVAIVTGALGRLGREYVGRWRGGRAVSARSTSPATRARSRALTAAGPARARRARRSVAEGPNRSRDRARSSAALGAPAILVNNAGMGSSPAAAGNENGPFEDYSEAAWDTMIDSHLKTTLFASQAFVRHFRAQRDAARGALQAASSTCRRPTAWCRRISRSTTTSAPAARRIFKPVGYSVAKSGVLNFTRWLAEYGAPLGIRANTLVPGGVREAGHAPEFVKRIREAHAARPDGERIRLQRRGAVSGVAAPLHT